MKELTYFYLPGCPFCKQASAWMEELIKENPDYEKIPVQRVDERQNRALADQYDYWLVPSFFIGDEKLHEGAATKDIIKKVLDKALE